MRKIEQMRGIKKSKLNKMDYLRKVIKADRTGEVREAVRQAVADTEHKDSK